ncbi:MAG TPA: aldo/keto reductase [Bacteroidales bacterium]|nr:aldo/keto reductase [Bacteroidales bacterium]HPT21064.1 aldo/keto reductase [Bacteroidales bacterium]
MKKSQRREFIKKSLMGLSGAALVPGTLNASIGQSPQQNKIPELPSRTLGRTGIKTPLISMGTGSANTPGFIKSGYYSGIKLFFSATYYGEGNNERLAGEGLKGLPRDSFVVGTAVPPIGFDDRKGKFTRDFTPEAFVKKTEASLKRFGMDYVDILLFPQVCSRENVMYEPMMKVLLDLKRQGKTKYIGIATHDMCEEAIIAAADAKIYDVIMVAYNYKVKNKTNLDKAIKYAADAGLGIVAIKTTAGAFYDKERTKPVNTDAALKWVLQNENISSIVSGMSSSDELNKNLAMIKNLKMSDKEINDLKLASMDSEPGLYCQQCKKCIPQCPHNLSIPAIMRSYMYAYGYKDLVHAQQTLLEAGLTDNSCQKCEVCNVNCISGFNIKERIQDISRLANVPGDFLKA